MSRFKEPILDGIGTTEILSTFISNSKSQFKMNSTGKLVSGFIAKLCDEMGESVKFGEVGMLWVKGDTYQSFYYKNQKLTEKHFHQGWFNTYDLFSQDEDGYYFYHGRANDLIKSGGVWIYPYKIEEIILKHAGIADCLVVGQEQYDGLCRPVAYIVAKDDVEDLEGIAESVKKLCKEKLSRLEYPHLVYFVKMIPKTATGKKKRYLLQGESIEKYGSTAILT